MGKLIIVRKLGSLQLQLLQDIANPKYRLRIINNAWSKPCAFDHLDHNDVWVSEYYRTDLYNRTQVAALIGRGFIAKCKHSEYWGITPAGSAYLKSVQEAAK